MTFSPDGRTLAAGSIDGTVWLWSLADPARATRLGKPLTGSIGNVNSVAFSPDGRTLAVGGGGDTVGQVWLWNVANPARPTRLGRPLTGPAKSVHSVAFSRDGILAAGSDDARVWLWNLADPGHPTAAQGGQGDGVRHKVPAHRHRDTLTRPAEGTKSPGVAEVSVFARGQHRCHL